MTRMVLERSRLAMLKYATSAAWDVRKKLTAFDRANLNEIFLAWRAGLPQLEVQDNPQKGEPKAYSKGRLLFRENWTTACSQKGWLRIFRRKGSLEEHIAVRPNRKGQIFTKSIWKKEQGFSGFDRANSKDKRSTTRVNIFPLTEGWESLLAERLTDQSFIFTVSPFSNSVPATTRQL